MTDLCKSARVINNIHVFFKIAYNVMIIKQKDSCKKMEQYTVQIYLVILAMLVMSVRIERNDLIERQKKREFLRFW